MSVLKSTDPPRIDTQIIGYANRRSGEVLCLRHGKHDSRSTRGQWVAVRLAYDPNAGYASIAPVICRQCGAWLNDESTGYAIVSPDNEHWRRCLRRARGHRNG